MHRIRAFGVQKPEHISANRTSQTTPFHQRVDREITIRVRMVEATIPPTIGAAMHRPTSEPVPVLT